MSLRTANDEKNFLCVPLYRFDDLPDTVQSRVMQKELEAWHEYGFNEQATDTIRWQLEERGLPSEDIRWDLSGHTYVRFSGSIDLEALVNASHSPREDLKDDIKKLLSYSAADVTMEIVMSHHPYYPAMEVEMVIDFDDELTGEAQAVFHKPFVTAAEGIRNRIGSYAGNTCYDLLKMIEADYEDTSWIRESVVEQDLWYLHDGTDASFLFINSRQEVLDGDFREATEVYLRRQEAQREENRVQLHVGRRQLRRGVDGPSVVQEASGDADSVRGG